MSKPKPHEFTVQEGSPFPDQPPPEKQQARQGQAHAREETVTGFHMGQPPYPDLHSLYHDPARREAAMREIARICCVSHEVAQDALIHALAAIENEPVNVTVDTEPPARAIVASDGGKGHDRPA